MRRERSGSEERRRERRVGETESVESVGREIEEENVGGECEERERGKRVRRECEVRE